jgi:hypothetical protein
MFVTRFARAGLLAGLVLSFFAVSRAPARADEDKPLPEFAAVKEAVKGYFGAIEGYRENDLLNREEVAPLFEELEKIGFPVPDKSEILADMLPESNNIVRHLSTRKGTRFMRQISGLPEAYDRLERLDKMPYGPYRVSELIRGPDGYTMIKYMTTTKGGRNLGIYLSQIKSGRNFNEKTGHIYTEKQLVTRLRTSYEKEYRRLYGKDAPKEKTDKKKRSTRRYGS